jgi:TIR domain
LATDGTKSIEIFYSYASTEEGRDEVLQRQLEKHLGVLKRQGKITNWHKRNILAGQVASEEISKHLNSAQIILLLISPDFVASDECWDIEMNRALERQKEEKTLVIPVLLRPLDYNKEAPFSHLRVLPKNGKPVTSWSNQDEAFEDIASNIRLLAEKFEKTQRISWKDLGAGISFAVAISTLVTSSTTKTPQVQSSKIIHEHIAGTTGRRPANGSGPFAVYPRYNPSGYVGDTGDITVAREPDLVRFTYVTKGRGPHVWGYMYIDGKLNPDPCKFGGVLYLNPSSTWGTDPHPGLDLRGRHMLTWKAHSLSGSIYVQFVIGRVAWNWINGRMVVAPYRGSMPWTSLGIKKLTSTLQAFTYDLSTLPVEYLRAVTAGFGWVIGWDYNGVQAGQPQTFVFEVQDIFYQ